jgi:hypothetical protein
LSQRERDRLRVLHEVKQKQITQIEAARRLPQVVAETLRPVKIRLPLRIYSLTDAFEILGMNANDASAWAVDVRYQSERNRNDQW